MNLREYLLKQLFGTRHAGLSFAGQELLLAIDQAPQLVPGAREMPAPKAVITAFKISVDF